MRHQLGQLVDSVFQQNVPLLHLTRCSPTLLSDRMGELVQGHSGAFWRTNGETRQRVQNVSDSILVQILQSDAQLLIVVQRLAALAEEVVPGLLRHVPVQHLRRRPQRQVQAASVAAQQRFKVTVHRRQQRVVTLC